MGNDLHHVEDLERQLHSAGVQLLRESGVVQLTSRPRDASGVVVIEIIGPSGLAILRLPRSETDRALEVLGGPGGDRR